MKRLWNKYCFSLILLVALAVPLRPVYGAFNEYQIKAVFLYNFAAFVTWPANTLSDSSFYTICILGEDPFGDILNITIEKKLIGNKYIKAKYLTNLDSIASCHILYISQSEKNNFSNIITILKEKPILTVSDIKGSALQGGIIEFVRKRKKIRFNMNPDNAAKAGLQIKANLYSLATVVTNNP